MAFEQLLQRVPALAGADPDVLSRLSSHASLRTYQRGDLLWRAGDQPITFVAVKAGLIKVVRTGAAGRRTTCGLFGPPESIGDIVLMKGVPYPADAVVVTESVSLVTVPRATFLSCIEVHPEMAISVARAIHLKLSALHDSIEVLSAGSVEARLATALLKLYRQFGDDFDDGTSNVPVSLPRRDLADLVSTSVETVIRIMTRWEREGVLDTEEDGFTIRDRGKLSAIAGHQPSQVATR